MPGNKAHTLTELLIASSIVVILFASCLGAYILTKNICHASITEYDLQRDVNTAMARMIKGMREGTEAFGLRSAKSYNIVSIDRIDFVGTDNNTRSYLVSGDAIIYESPLLTQQQKSVYEAADSDIILRFWNPYYGQPNNDNATIGIYLSLSREVDGRTISGSSSTYVNLKNIPK